MYKRIFIFTTEPSGDDLGFLLLKKLKKKYPYANISGLGGEKMKSLKFNSIFPISDLSVNGIMEVLTRINYFRKKIKELVIKILIYKPDLIISIDSPSFCLRVIRKIQKLRSHSKFVHLVTPTVWAWKKYRAKQFASSYDLLLSLYEFEPQYFTEFNNKTFFIGHPIFYDKRKVKKIDKISSVALFPGSRTNEVNYILPELLKSIKIINAENNFSVSVITLDSLQPLVRKLCKNHKVEIISNEKEKKKILFSNTNLAIAASGTVVLELAKNYIPMIVVYKCNTITAKIVSFFVKSRWANIVNITFNKEVIPELLFSNCNKDNIVKLTKKMIDVKGFSLEQVKYFKILRKKMLNNNKNPIDLAINHIDNLQLNGND